MNTNICNIPITCKIEKRKKIVDGAISWFESLGDVIFTTYGRKNDSVLEIPVNWISAVEFCAPVKLIVDKDDETKKKLHINLVSTADNNVKFCFSSFPPLGYAEKEHWEYVTISW